MYLCICVSDFSSYILNKKRKDKEISNKPKLQILNEILPQKEDEYNLKIKNYTINTTNEDEKRKIYNTGFTS